MVSTRDCYEEAARSAGEGRLSCCAPCAPQHFGAAAYPERELAGIPEGARTSAMGCGHPVAEARLAAGQVVLDLGCGTGLDALLAARAVGPAGRVVGVDLIPGLVELARRHSREAKAGNTEFHVGAVERLPLADGSVDVAIANGTVSVADDKPAAFAETHRVLRPGGWLVATDFVLDEGLDPAGRAAASKAAGCRTGTFSATEFRAHLIRAGFRAVHVRRDARVADGMHLGLLRAQRP